MSEQLKESLSAVMDGEADEFEIRRVLNEAADDPELRGVWERYHLVSSVMRGEGRGGIRADALTTRLWTAIDSEAVPDHDDPTEIESNATPLRRSRWGSWGQRIAGVAVAAGVAAAVIVGFRGEDTNISATPAVAVVEPAAAPATAALFGDEARDKAVPTAALDVQRAHAYMLHHARHVSLNNRSVVPFVKVAAFESK